MKKIILLIVLSLVITSVNAQVGENFIIGTWKVDVDHFAGQLNDVIEAEFPNPTTEEELEELEMTRFYAMMVLSVLDGLTVTYQDDETFFVVQYLDEAEEPNIMTGTWYIWDGILNQVFDADEKLESSEILELTEDVMLLELKSEETGESQGVIRYLKVE